jgi:hypothetical protein
MEETGVPGEYHQPAASHWQTLWHNVVSRTPRLEREIQIIVLLVEIIDNYYIADHEIHRYPQIYKWNKNQYLTQWNVTVQTLSHNVVSRTSRLEREIQIIVLLVEIIDNYYIADHEIHRYPQIYKWNKNQYLTQWNVTVQMWSQSIILLSVRQWKACSFLKYLIRANKSVISM